VVNPFFDLWKASRRATFQLCLGHLGPKEADELLERDGRRWRNLDK